MGNPFVHVELNTGDLAGARKFYKNLFDWKLPEMKMGDGSAYTMVDVGDRSKTGGGMQQNPMPDAPPLWLAYVEVADVKKSLAKARKLGAKIVQEYTPIPGMGALGIFVDPAGAALGIYETPPPAPKKAAKPAKADAKKPAAKKDKDKAKKKKKKK